MSKWKQKPFRIDAKGSVNWRKETPGQNTREEEGFLSKDQKTILLG